MLLNVLLQEVYEKDWNSLSEWVTDFIGISLTEIIVKMMNPFFAGAPPGTPQGPPGISRPHFENPCCKVLIYSHDSVIVLP